MMNEEVEKELRRRCDILIQHAKPGEIGTGMSGSMICFMAALAPIGCALGDKYDWMDEEYKKPIMSDETFHGNTYDQLFVELFQTAYRAVNVNYYSNSRSMKIVQRSRNKRHTS